MSFYCKTATPREGVILGCQPPWQHESQFTITLRQIVSCKSNGGLGEGRGIKPDIKADIGRKGCNGLG